jgi:hypothetical protein
MTRITTKTHGLLEYAVGGALAMLPQFVPCTKATARVLEAAGIGAGVYSTVTDYERGLVKMLPMEAHLTLDAMSGAGLITAATLLHDERPAVRAMLVGLGLFEITVASMTSTEPYTRGRSPTPAELVADRIAHYV